MTNAVGNVVLGTSGWSYEEWVGPFYRKEDKSMLKAYARVFSTVEIDSTFYRYPSKGTVMGWTRYSPEGFVYAAKLPGLMTHDKRLDLSRGIEEDLRRFLELMEPLFLSGKLGCILIQLPPKFDYRPKQLEDFFSLLPSHVKFAVEFRDLSWMRDETWQLLKKYNVAYTIVDEPLLPPEIHVTSDIAYFRWHGRGTRPWYNYHYQSRELEPWTPKVRETAKQAKKIFGYFNNHYHGYAVENCLQIMEMLGSLDPKQQETKNHIEAFRKDSTRQTLSTLDAFAAPKDASFENLLAYFVPSERLKRAKLMPDEELAISEQTGDMIDATVREYHILIDLKNETIKHDCADWLKIASTKKLCKHVAKLLLSIDRAASVSLLRTLHNREDEWQFDSYP